MKKAIKIFAGIGIVALIAFVVYKCLCCKDGDCEGCEKKCKKKCEEACDEACEEACDEICIEA